MEHENANSAEVEDTLNNLPWNIRFGLFYADDVDDGILESIPDSLMQGVRWAPAFSSATIASLAAVTLAKKTRMPLTYSLRGRVKKSISPRWSALFTTACAAGTFLKSCDKNQLKSLFSSLQGKADEGFTHSSSSDYLAEYAEGYSHLDGWSENARHCDAEQLEKWSEFSNDHESLSETSDNAKLHDASTEGENRRDIINRNAFLASINVSIILSQVLAFRQKDGKISVPSTVALAAASVAVEPFLHFFLTRAGLKRIVSNFVRTEQYWAPPEDNQ